MAKKRNKVRKDGRIAVQVYLGMVDGKRKYKTVYGLTQKEADEKALQIKLSMRKGLDVTADQDTFGDWANRWMLMKKQEVCYARATVYESYIKHLNRRFDFAHITKIRTVEIQELVTQLSNNNPNTNKPMAYNTLCNLKGAAHQIFQYAIDNRVMDYNPVRAVKIPNVNKPTKRRALTNNEQCWILETEHQAKRAAMIMMYAGLRRGELIPLTWNDVDLDERTISVNKTVEMVENRYCLKDTAKTKAGIRTIDIPQRLADYLRNEKRESIYVCVSNKNKLHTRSSWDWMWNNYLATLNLKYGDFSPFEKNAESKYDSDNVPFIIPQITPHWLRHTFATMLYMSGVDILTAKEQLGHADIQTTLEIYTHLDAVHKRKAMNKLDDYLDNASHIQVNCS